MTNKEKALEIIKYQIEQFKLSSGGDVIVWADVIIKELEKAKELLTK